MHITRTKWFWFAVSFTSGLVGLGLEISASRLLAPVFGTSTVVWSSVIGVVLLALSAGYYVGGRLA
jgi:predicted membrane-bound spermidine synthase